MPQATDAVVSERLAALEDARQKIGDQLRRRALANRARPTVPTKIDQRDAAWAAGLFVGEGWCGVIRRGERRYIQISIQMLDREALRHFAAMFDRHMLQFRLPYDKTRFCYRVNAAGRSAEAIVRLMWPHLAETAKGAQIERACREVGVMGWIDGTATEPRAPRDGGNQKTGTRQTAETRAKMSATQKARWARIKGESAE
jgi:hypothetical protein